jgi:hypothetical protein
MWFQVLLTPLTGVLFTFPSRYWSTIGRQGVFSLTGWSRQIQAGLHVSRLTWVPRSAPPRFRVRDCHALWCAFPGASASTKESYRGPATLPPLAWRQFRLGPVSLAATPGITRCFLFLRVLRCFTSPGSLAPPYEFGRGGMQLFAAPGFPIRTSPAQRSVGNSPELFAATHVLHRLLAPRHPPHALSSLLHLYLPPPHTTSRWDASAAKRGPGPRLFAAGAPGVS